MVPRVPVSGPVLVASVLALACNHGPSPNGPSAVPTVPSAATTSASAPLSPQAIQSLLAADDRTAVDRKLDASRHPAELLAFLGVAPGMTVADLGAETGYTTELLARAVGPTGKVYGENDPVILKFMEERWAERLARPADKIVVRSDRALDDPLPPEARELDLVVINLFYHDSVALGTDRDRMNKAVYAALKPKGSYVIVDASALPGHGIADAKRLHRIEQASVESEVEKAGFSLAATAEFLRNPGDTRDWSSIPRQAGDRVGTEDRFVLRFTKPVR
jgi:predicted methyltransferase